MEQTLADLQRILEVELGSAQLPDAPSDYERYRAGWWQILTQAPAALGPAAARLSSCPEPEVLAFLYAQQQGETHPLQLQGLAAQLVPTGRQELYALSGLRGLSRPCQLYGFDPDSLALRSMRFEGFCCAGEPALRRVCFFSPWNEQDHAEPSEAMQAAALVLHEELHSAFALEAQPDPAFYHQQLAADIDEQVCTLLQGLVIDRWAQRAWPRPSHWWGQLGGLASGDDGLAGVTQLIQLNLDSMRAPSDQARAELLNRWSGHGQSWSVEQWESRLHMGGSYQRVAPS